MKIRPAAVAAVAAVSLLLTGCASSIAGTAGGPIAAVVNTGSLPGAPSDLPTTGAGLPTVPTDTAPASDLPTQDTTAPPTDSPQTDSPQTDSPPTDAPQTDSPPTDAPQTDSNAPDTGLPTNLPGELPTSIPGLSPECSAVYQVILLFAAPMMGNTAITAAQVESTFAGLADAPAALQDDLAILKGAATKMIGKSGTDAMMALGDPTVSPALDAVTQYMSETCKYTG